MNIKSLVKVVSIVGVLLLGHNTLSISIVHAEEPVSKAFTLKDYHGASASTLTLPWKNIEVSDKTNLGIVVDMSTFLSEFNLDQIIGLVKSDDKQFDIKFNYVDKDKKLVGLSVDNPQLENGKYSIVIYNPNIFAHLKYDEQAPKKIGNKLFTYSSSDSVATNYAPMTYFTVSDNIEETSDDEVTVQWIKYEWTKANNDLGMAIRVTNGEKAIDANDIKVLLTDNHKNIIEGSVTSFEDKEYGKLFNLHLNKKQLQSDTEYKMTIQYHQQDYDIPNQYFETAVELDKNMKAITKGDNLIIVKSLNHHVKKVEQKTEEKSIINKIIDKIMPNETKKEEVTTEVASQDISSNQVKMSKDDTNTATQANDNNTAAKTPQSMNKKTLPATGMTTVSTGIIGLGLLLVAFVLMMMKQRRR